jgi:hypothetical protein
MLIRIKPNLSLWDNCYSTASLIVAEKDKIIETQNKKLEIIVNNQKTDQFEQIMY